MMYLAAPYTPPPNDPSLVEWRMKQFCFVDYELQKQGIHSVSPLLKHVVRMHYPEIPGDWEFWKEYSKMLIACSKSLGVITIEGWKGSNGVTDEINLFIEAKKPVSYIEIIFNDPPDATKFIPRELAMKWSPFNGIRIHAAPPA